jgi:hypothetical protein
MLKSQTSINLVIAAYKENLNWVKNINHPTIIYNKNNLPVHNFNCTIVDLVNVGRESHSYLHHIITNYNSLADITVFAQGNPFDHCSEFIKIANCYSIKRMNDLAKKCDKRNWPESNNNFCMFGHAYHANYKTIDHWGYQWILPYAIISLEIFHSRKAAPTTFTGNWGAMFAVSKEFLLRFHINKYKELYDLHYKYWSLPWALELTWYHIFNDYN